MNLTCNNFVSSQEYSVRTTQLALCQVVCDQLSIPQVRTRFQFFYRQTSQEDLKTRTAHKKLLNYVLLQPDLESGLVFTGVRGGPTRMQQPLRPTPTK